MRRLLFCLMLSAVVLLAPTKGWACWCSQPEDVSYKGAGAIFTVKIIDDTGLTEHGSKKMLGRVLEVYKGKPAEEVSLLSGGPTSCDISLKKGVKYLVYGQTWPKDVYSSHYCNTYPVPENDSSIKAVIAAMEDRRRQVDALGDAIAQNPKQERLLLKTMAEHEVYWKDYANAEDSLRRLTQLQPVDSWTKMQLFNALFAQRKAQEIWDFYEDFIKDNKDRLREEVIVAVSFAAFELGKHIGEWFGYSLKETRVADKDLSKHKFRSLSLQDSVLENVNFSGARFESTTWRKSTVKKNNLSRSAVKHGFFEDSKLIEVNFSGSQFERMTAKDTRFMEVDFSGANLKKGQISGSEFHQAKFKDADMTETKIKDTSFRKADISGADFTGASFEDVDWTDVIYDCKTKGAPLPPKACTTAP